MFIPGLGFIVWFMKNHCLMIWALEGLRFMEGLVFIGWLRFNTRLASIRLAASKGLHTHDWGF